MVCRKFKIYISSFHVHLAMKPFHIHMNEAKAHRHAYNFKALSIFFAKLLDFKVWKNYTLRNFCSQTGPTMCHGNNFNSKTIWSRKVKFWLCSYG